MTCPSQSSRLNHSYTIERYKLWSSSLWSLLHSPFSFLLSLNIRHNIIFSNNRSLHSFLNITDHLAQLTIWLFHIFNFQILRENSRRQKYFDCSHNYDIYKDSSHSGDGILDYPGTSQALILRKQFTTFLVSPLLYSFRYPWLRFLWSRRVFSHLPLLFIKKTLFFPLFHLTMTK